MSEIEEINFEKIYQIIDYCEIDKNEENITMICVFLSFEKDVVNFHKEKLKNLSDKKKIKYIKNITELEFQLIEVNLTIVPNVLKLSLHKDFNDCLKRWKNNEFEL